ncbi:ABC-three component system middle component 2 [Cellulomonas sp. RIT-PI-Y]|uniref:ABC-three component system middle component 2 n=1 Tax=Cellulomonas sp. RIT-PI-Y TaxID=3035297 RepID=UPI003211E29A
MLNSPLEVGVRVVATLTALYPKHADLARIVLLDHVVLHSADFHGEDSLHPQVPGRVAELGVKRELVQQGIRLMGARGLVVRELKTAGLYYMASEDARPFLDSIDAPYLRRLRERSAWAVNEFGGMRDDAIRMRLGDTFGRWAEEFEPVAEDGSHG